MTARPVSFEEIVDTVLDRDVPEVFASSGSRLSPKHVPGVRGRFDSLLDWEELNRVVAAQPLDGWRIQVLQGGRIISADEWARRSPLSPLEPDADTRWRVDGYRLPHLLRSGATLQIRHAHQLLPSVEALRSRAEERLGCAVGTQLWLAGGSTISTREHWDSVDVLVFHIAGDKRWEIHPPTRISPLGRDREHSAVAPSEVAWTGVVRSGDVLFCGRGWWHSVWNVGPEPTAHVSLTIGRPTGIDLLGWLLEELLEHDVVREHLPTDGSPEEQAALAARLWVLLSERWHDDVIDEFLRFDNGMVAPAALSLPWSIGTPLPEEDGYTIESASPRPVEVVEGQGEVEVRALSRRWRFAPAAAPLLREILAGRPVSLDGLVRFADDVTTTAQLRSLVATLIDDGLLTLRRRYPA